MKELSFTRRSDHGFTLLELLVVITIIGILASMAYVGGAAAMKRARIAQTESQMHNLKNAISSYLTEYRRYPVDRVGTTESATSPFLSDETLMNALLGDDREKVAGGLNPRGEVFYSARPAKPLGDGGYRNGVKLVSTGGGELFDSWGNHFRVVFDLDANSRVPAPGWETDTIIPATIIIWSPGPDGEDSESGDNVTSW